MITLNIKFPLKPNKAQRELLWTWSRAMNRLYNHFLMLQEERVQQHSLLLSRFDMNNLIPQLKFEIQDLDQVCANVRQSCSTVVAATMTLWRKHRTRFPSFRSDHLFFNLTYPAFARDCKFEGSYFCASKLPPIKVNRYRDIPGTIKTATIRCDVSGKWWLLLACSVDRPNIDGIRMDKMIGIDVGCRNILTTSDGYNIPKPEFITHTRRAIRRLYNRIDLYHKPTGSKSDGTYHESRKCKALKKTIKRLKYQMYRRIRNFLHTRSRELASRYDIIVMEDLNLRDIIHDHSSVVSAKISSSLRVNSIRSFARMLMYKAKQCVMVNQAYTSRVCSLCGNISTAFSVRTKVFKCVHCRHKIDRDINAALNIRNLGLLYLKGLARPKACILDVTRHLEYCNSLLFKESLADKIKEF